MRSIQKEALWFILQVILIAIIFFFMGMSVAESEEPELKVVSDARGCPITLGNSYISISAPFYVKPMIYGSIVECLEQEESSGNINIYNPCDTDGYPKYGCLQFHIPTFKMFCVDKYGLTNDIWDCNIQKECASLMIKDGYLYHWGTANKCRHLLK